MQELRCHSLVVVKIFMDRKENVIETILGSILFVFSLSLMYLIPAALYFVIAWIAVSLDN